MDMNRAPSLVPQRASVAAAIFLALSGSPRAEDPVQILRQVRMPDRTIMITRFDHASGTASRIVLDEISGKVLQEQTYPGRPQSSRYEFHDAVMVIRCDLALGQLIAEGAVVEGGFIVDGPAGHPASHRYIQMRLLSADRRSLLRIALVDLTERVIASTRSSFE
jgi:hypothetical protein